MVKSEQMELIYGMISGLKDREWMPGQINGFKIIILMDEWRNFPSGRMNGLMDMN